MPLFKTIHINDYTTAYVWKISETLPELKQIYLSENSLNRVLTMKSATHQKGFLSIRHLLKSIEISDSDLYYNEFGKPLLKNNLHISITHSFDFSAIVISEKITGIDIEMVRPKIQKIKHRFTDIEINETNPLDILKKLTFIWGAKESLFKIHPTGGIHFKDELIIQDFTLTDLQTQGNIQTKSYQNQFEIYFFEIENYALAIATPF